MKIAISGKGGVGKTTLAALLAMAYRERLDISRPTNIKERRRNRQHRPNLHTVEIYCQIEGGESNSLG